jgi:N-acetylneuraminic acid mutarotase
MKPTRRLFAAGALAAPFAGACQNQADQGDAPAGAWRSAPDAPYAVQEIYPALYRGAIWIAGGFSPQALGATDRVITFELARGAWTEGPKLPTRSHHVHLAVLGDALYAVGGFMGGLTGVRWICTPRVLRFEGEGWVEAPSLPKPMAEGAPVVHEGRMHLIGGRSPLGEANADWDDQGDVGDHFVLAAGASRWERAAALPMPRNSTASAAFGGAIHVISGRTVASGQTPAHHIYDAREDRWREGPAFPEPRGGLAAAVLGGRIVCGGGEIFEPGSVGDALYAYDDASGWQRFETMPTPRHGHGFVVAGDALYALGGARRPSADGTLARVDVLG